jgi:hypothetical protein
MTGGLIGLLGGGGALVLGIWLWRLKRIAGLIKALSIAAVAVGGLSMLGIIEVSVNPGAAIDTATLVWDLAWRLWGAI